MLSQDRFSNFSCVLQTAKDSPHVFAFSFASRVRGLSRHNLPLLNLELTCSSGLSWIVSPWHQPEDDETETSGVGVKRKDSRHHILTCFRAHAFFVVAADKSDSKSFAASVANIFFFYTVTVEARIQIFSAIQPAPPCMHKSAVELRFVKAIIHLVMDRAQPFTKSSAWRNIWRFVCYYVGKVFCALSAWVHAC